MTDAIRPTGHGLWPTPSWLSAAWAFAESTFFFIVPDLPLSWACLGGVRQGFNALAAVMLGSLLGGILMYALAASQPDLMRAAVAHVPFVRAAMFGTVEASYREHGPMGMLYGPTSGIPYKIYAILAPEFFGVASFVLTSIPARLERLALSWLVFTMLGQILGSAIAAHRRLTFVLFGLLWVGIYGFYWSKS